MRFTNMDISYQDTSLPLLKSSKANLANINSNIKSASNVENIEKIEHAAKEFEAVFLTEMLKPMFEGIKPNALTGGGKGEEIFNSFLLQEYGKMMVDRGGIGIAEHVKQELIRVQQEAKS